MHQKNTDYDKETQRHSRCEALTASLRFFSSFYLFWEHCFTRERIFLSYFFMFSFLSGPLMYLKLSTESFVNSYQYSSWRRIHERTILIRFLVIILSILRIQCLHQFHTTFVQKDSATIFSTSGFFHESVPPSPWVYH
jgi:hypothetical protein